MKRYLFQKKRKRGTLSEKAIQMLSGIHIAFER